MYTKLYTNSRDDGENIAAQYAEKPSESDFCSNVRSQEVRRVRLIIREESYMHCERLIVMELDMNFLNDLSLTHTAAWKLKHIRIEI